MALRGMRPSEELRAGRSTLNGLLQRQLGNPGDFVVGIPYTQGQIAALDWLLGLAETTPLTARSGVGSDDVREIDREADLATGMLHGRAVMDLRGRSYVAGVEFALMWVRYETVDDEL